jgi:predicted RNA-binding protein with PIN domain
VSEPTADLPMPALPGPVRQRLVVLAAQTLGGLPADQVPAALRAVARFAPARRARAGAGQLAAALDVDAVFRQQVTATVRQLAPDLMQAIQAGAPPPAADPVELAALAYLARPSGWAGIVAAAAAELVAAGEAAEVAALETAVTGLSAELTDLRAEHAAALAAVLGRAEEHRADAAEARRRLREAEADLGRAKAAAERERAAAEQTRQDAAGRESAAGAQTRQLRARLADVEASLEASRRSAREGRSSHDVRLRLLLDSLLGAANGLRQELALPPVVTLPADLVASALPGAGQDVAVRGHAGDDPALLDQLLGLPGVHLLVDGYNVTKTGYGTLSLAEQRARLLSGLAALVARTRVEVTCVFDGATLDGPVLSAAPRGVRVLFSQAGQTADELIDRLVRAEPPGRPLVVVSTDGEVAARAVAAGARSVASAALARRLDRA